MVAGSESGILSSLSWNSNETGSKCCGIITFLTNQEWLRFCDDEKLDLENFFISFIKFGMLSSTSFNKQFEIRYFKLASNKWI